MTAARGERVRAARLHAVGDLRVADEPEPEAGPGMSLVRVTAVGICGSDLHWWDEGAIGDAKLTHPLVLGHEGAGVIADGPRRGERVAIDPAIPDETCRACRDGYRNLCYRIRFSGHGEAVGLAMASVRPGGRVVLAGIPGDDAIGFGASLARRKGLTIAMVRRMNEVYPRAIGLAVRGVVDLGSVVTSRFGLGQVREAFADGARRTGLKVVVEPQR